MKELNQAYQHSCQCFVGGEGIIQTGEAEVVEEFVLPLQFHEREEGG
jgi:hypothetical protein